MGAPAPQNVPGGSFNPPYFYRVGVLVPSNCKKWESWPRLFRFKCASMRELTRKTGAIQRDASRRAIVPGWELQFPESGVRLLSTCFL